MERRSTFGQWLKRRRQTLDLQQSELAARIGCAVVTLRKIETDQRKPSRQIATLLAEHLDIPFAEREQFIESARSGLSIDTLSLSTSKPLDSTNLPVPTTSLVGRDQDIEAVCALVSDPDVRLLTLTGPLGVGKTRLAIAAASAQQGGFADGVFFVDLASLDKPDSVATAIAHVLRVIGADKHSLPERLGRYLRKRQVLLLLDTFEHVLATAPLLAQLLATAPHLKILVTSRTVLRIAGEHRFAVPPLQVAPPSKARKRALTAREAQARYSAIDLFVQRAWAVVPSFKLTDDNVETINELCHLLDGLPMVIEFIAARIWLLTPIEHLNHLKYLSVRLSNGEDEPSAQDSDMWAEQEWSYRLLDSDTQRLLRRLSVFVGECTMEAAQHICDDEGTLGTSVHYGIETLVASSLLQGNQGHDGYSWFRMIAFVRSHAAYQLARSGEAGLIRKRHAAYYLALTEQARQAWDQPHEWDCLRQLALARDNVFAALRWAIDTGNTVLALRATAALHSFWVICADLPEARHWLDAALALPRPDDTTELLALEANVLNVAGDVALDAADYVQALHYFERGLALYTALDDQRGQVASLRGCALVHIQRGEYAAAEAAITHCLQRCREIDDTYQEGWSLYVLAFLRLGQRDLVQAQQVIEQALVSLRQRNNPFAIFRAVLVLGYLRFEQGDIVGAETHYCEALELSQQAPVPALMTIGLEGLATVAAIKGQPLRAARLGGAAEALREVTLELKSYAYKYVPTPSYAARRTQLGEAEWTGAWAAGRAFTPQQTVAEALAGIE